MRTDGGLNRAVVAKNKFKIQNIVPDGLDGVPNVDGLAARGEMIAKTIS